MIITEWKENVTMEILLFCWVVSNITRWFQRHFGNPKGMIIIICATVLGTLLLLRGIPKRLSFLMKESSSKRTEEEERGLIIKMPRGQVKTSPIANCTSRHWSLTNSRAKACPVGNFSVEQDNLEGGNV